MSLGLIAQLPSLGLPESLAHQVKKVSDLYIQRSVDISQIWLSSELAKAYISYFLPLNALRVLSVLNEAKERNFFSNIENVIDFGSGPGTFDLTATSADIKFASYHFIESQKEAIAWHKNLLKTCLGISSEAGRESHNNMSSESENQTKISRHWSLTAPNEIPSKQNTLAVFSYSLNELSELPHWAYDVEALMIIEPSQQQNGRNLQTLRQKLIDTGFSIWAPCTHQMSCPLHAHSKSDWCHNRVHVELPTSLKEIERYLPMKNQTLTYSYLLARKTKAPVTDQVRLIGDTLYERGKVKQALCRGEQREFLTWLTRHGDPEPLPRGARITLPREAEERGNEIRMPPSPSK